MTSRLKHKLDLEQINVKSAYLNESFVQIGTPLPALAESRKDKLEYVPEWQQEVRDEQGRRRFHGAFTGGFSAGYYNSVGSKEGWSPATFKSSRNNRAAKVQRPEDFMDEEDLAAMKEDRTLENTETFRSDRIGSTKAELEGKGVSSALASLIEPAKTSIGQTLLRKQGWRPGQGIGPRISLRRLKQQDAKAGREMGEDEEMSEDVAGVGKHLFAPRDTKLVVYDTKEEKQGLGYVRGMGRGIERAPALTIRASHVDMDEDDDPYSVAGPSTSARPFAFAAEDEDEDMPVVIGGPTPTAAPSRSLAPTRTVTDIDTTRWHDGRPVLNGFELDPLGVPADKWFEMPEIPPEWRPRPARVWGTGKRWDEKPGEVKVEKEVMRGQPGRPLTFEQRGTALGETITPSVKTTPAAIPAAEESKTSKAKSVFEYMSEKDRERIQAIAALARAGASKPPPLQMTDEPPPTVAGPSRPTEVVIPPLSPRTAGAALRGFIPYGDDPPKQDRYRSYLSSQTLNSRTPIPNLRSGHIDEINKELEDFYGSARIFKPLSFAMSSRFTSGSASLAGSDMKQAKPGLHMYDAEKAALEMAEAKKVQAGADKAEEKRNMTPRERAAAEGRYGVETRVVKEWYPVKLVCRRFGVQDPHPEGEPKGGGGGEEGELPKNDASWEDKFIYKPAETAPDSGIQAAAGALGTGKVGEEEGGGERVPKTLAEVGMADDINQGRDTLTYTKPSIDILKAIFASDDEDSDDDDNGDNDGGEDEDDSISVSKPISTLIPARPAIPAAPADLATFKPVFQVKREREDGDAGSAPQGNGSHGSGAANGAATDGGKKKRKKDKSKRGGVLSFQVDDDEGEEGEGEKKAKRKMERKEMGSAPVVGTKHERVGREVKEEKRVAAEAPIEDLEDEWVEKVPVVPVGRTGPVGRKGAADFM